MPAESTPPPIFDDAARIELERPFRGSGGVAWPTVALGVGVLALAAGTTYGAVRGIVPLALVIPLHVIWGYLAFTPAHEAAHGNVAGANARLGWLDDVVGWTLSAVLTLPYPMLRYLHLRHHSHTNDPELDPDHRVAGTSALSIAFRCWTVQLGYVRVLGLLLREGSPGAKEALRGVRLYAVGTAAFYAAAFHFGFVGWALLLWALPASIAQGFLALVFDWLPHRPHTGRERYRDTRIQLSPGLETLLLGQNFHLIHHLYPRVPFYGYSRCFGIVRELLVQKGARIDGR